MLTNVFAEPCQFGKQEKAPEQRETSQFFFKTTGFTQTSMVDRILNLYSNSAKKLFIIHDWDLGVVSDIESKYICLITRVAS